MHNLEDGGVVSDVGVSSMVHVPRAVEIIPHLFCSSMRLKDCDKHNPIKTQEMGKEAVCPYSFRFGLGSTGSLTRDSDWL